MTVALDGAKFPARKTVTLRAAVTAEGSAITDLQPYLGAMGHFILIHQDGETFVLGGMVSDRSVHSTERFPYLSDIPLIGTLFRGKSNETRQTSLLIFVTPDIVDTAGAKYNPMDETSMYGR